MLKKFLPFGVVGFIGFVADCIVLYLFKDFLGLYLVRILSFVCAVFVTWNLNRKITFRNFDSGKSKIAEFSTYFSYMLAGGLVNYLIYIVLISISPLMHELPIIAVAAGSLGGVTVNYVLSTTLFANKVD